MCIDSCQTTGFLFKRSYYQEKQTLGLLHIDKYPKQTLALREKRRLGHLDNTSVWSPCASCYNSINTDLETD